MIKVLKTLNYYQIIGVVDFSISVFTSAKMLDLEEINITERVQNFLLSLRTRDLFEELEAAFLQRNDDNYAGTDSFPQYELFAPFADWEIKDGKCQKKPLVRASQCVERTLQYLCTFLAPWDYHSLEFRKPVEPNPFAQTFGSDSCDTPQIENNPEEVRKITEWLKEFNNLNLQEKLSLLRTLDKRQGKKVAFRMWINRKGLITLSILHGNWNEDTSCLINLLLSTKVCSSMVFEMGWQKQDDISQYCKLWIHYSIERLFSMFQIFKWELLDGVELSVQTLSDFRKSRNNPFLGIEIDPYAYINRWTKKDNEYLFPQKNLHLTTDTIKFDTGQSSRAPLKSESALVLASSK